MSGNRLQLRLHRSGISFYTIHGSQCLSKYSTAFIVLWRSLPCSGRCLHGVLLSPGEGELGLERGGLYQPRRTGFTACLLWLLCILPIIWALHAKQRLASVKQRSHSLVFKKVFADQMRLKRNEKQRNCFGHKLEKPKYFDFFGMKKEALNFCLSLDPSELLKEPYHFPKRTLRTQCQLGLSQVTRTNSCLPSTIHGEKHRQIIFIRTASLFSFQCST